MTKTPDRQGLARITTELQTRNHLAYRASRAGMEQVQQISVQVENLLFNPQHSSWLCPLILVVDGALTAFIVKAIPCKLTTHCQHYRPLIWDITRHRDRLDSLHAADQDL